VQGFLQDPKTAKNHFGKSYTGGTPRHQAHAFADEIVQYLRGTKPVFQSAIAFKIDKGAAKEICIADFDGHNPQQVTRDDAIVAAPCWVPGQRVLVYNSYKDKFPGIYSHDLNSGVRRPVATYAGSSISPAAGRGGRVAMILSKGGSPNLYVSDLDGGSLRQLTKTREGESSPCWSPDGQQVCFVSRRDGNKALYVISAAGGEMRKIRTAGVMNATEPDWSPDGKTIVFTTQTGANSFEICTVPAEGGEAARLVAGEDPSWAANSRTVIFARRSGAGMKVLSLLDVPTKRVKDGAQVSGSASQPSWAR
jgi:TolB protein